MCDVFLAASDAQHVDFTKLVVIKKLRDELAQNGDFVTMFLDEARIAARLNHPNVIQTLEVGQEGTDFFLAMEYLDGQPLSTIRRASRPPLHIHLAVLADVLTGIQYAHELRDYDGSPLRIVHRDVTPQNVFVTYDGQIKVMDFGIAKAAGRAAETRVGVLKGKVKYMSPEQVRSLSGEPDGRVDVFAVGVMLYEACTQERMWRGSDATTILRSLITDSFPKSPKERNPLIHDDLDRICRKALAFRPEDRYPSAAAMQEDLDRHITDHSRRPSPRQIGTYVAGLFAEQRRRTRQLIEEQLSGLVRDRRSVVAIPVDCEEPLTDPGSSSEPSDTSLRATESQISRVAAPQDESPRAKSSTPPGRRASGRSAWSEMRKVALAVVAGVATGALVIGAAGPSTTGTHEPAAAPAVASTPETVTLTLRAAPAETRFRIDDRPWVANPYEGKLPRDHAVHHVFADAPGFDAKTQDVRFDHDLSVHFTLVRAAQTQP
jgi:serine/threonine-protein kinase